MKTAGFLLALVLSNISLVPATAQTPSKYSDAANHIVAQWNKWVGKHSISKASIVVFKNGKQIASGGVGREIDEPVPVASLTKAITGVCIQKLIESGKLTHNSILSELVPGVKSSVTIAQLLNQTSGYEEDITQNPDNYPGVDREYLDWVVREQLTKAGTRSVAGKYSYNNSNYAMLGLVITKVTGKNYEQSCKELVLKPTGIETAQLNPKWRIMSSWGGWKISTLDYGRFVSTYFSKNTFMDNDPFELPNVALGGGAYYGMGFLFRQGRRGGYSFWHDGKWDAIYKGKHYRFAAFFVRLSSDWTIVATHNISAINGEHADLERHIYAPPKN